MIHNDLQETNCKNIAKLEAITCRELNHEKQIPKVDMHLSPCLLHSKKFLPWEAAVIICKSQVQSTSFFNLQVMCKFKSCTNPKWSASWGSYDESYPYLYTWQSIKGLHLSSKCCTNSLVNICQERNLSRIVQQTVSKLLYIYMIFITEFLRDASGCCQNES